MRRAIQLAAKLYPGPWRSHYGEEFEALLEDHNPGWREFSDVLRGALQMQLTNAASYAKLAAAVGIAGAVVAIAISFSLPGRYQSSAILRITPERDQVFSSDAEQRANQKVNEIEQEILSRTSLEGLITSPQLDLYKKDRAKMPMEDIVQRMRNRDVQIRLVKSSGAGFAVAISFAYPDRLKAQQVTRELVTRFTEETVVMQRNQFRLWKAVWPDTEPPSGERLEILDVPSLPKQSVGPNHASYAAWGLAAGIMLGLIVAAAMHRPKWTLQMAGFGLIFCALGFGISRMFPEMYTSTCIMRMMPPQVPERPGSEIAVTPPTAWLERLKSEVLREGNAGGPAGDALRQNLRIERLRPLLGSPDGSRTFAISFTDPDRQKAQVVVREIAVRFTEQNVRDNRTRARASGDPKIIEIEERKLGENLEVMDPPSDPQAPVSPNRLEISLAGFGVGLLLGAVTLYWRQRGPAALPA